LATPSLEVFSNNEESKFIKQEKILAKILPTSTFMISSYRLGIVLLKQTLDRLEKIKA